MTAAWALAGPVAMMGVLVMFGLYVRQRREVSRLRRWAGSAPERARSAHHDPAAFAPPRRWRVFAAAAAAIATVVVVGYLLARPSGEPRGTAAGAPTARVDDLADLPRARRSRVPVAVLNGSSIAGLADRTARRLAALGFAQDVIANAPRRTPRATQVAYADADGTSAAAAIASVLHAGQPVRAEPAAHALARHAEVIVTVGGTRH